MSNITFTKRPKTIEFIYNLDNEDSQAKRAKNTLLSKTQSQRRRQRFSIKQLFWEDLIQEDYIFNESLEDLDEQGAVLKNLNHLIDETRSGLKAGASTDDNLNSSSDSQVSKENEKSTIIRLDSQISFGCLNQKEAVGFLKNLDCVKSLRDDKSFDMIIQELENLAQITNVNLILETSCEFLDPTDISQPRIMDYITLLSRNKSSTILNIFCWVMDHDFWLYDKVHSLRSLISSSEDLLIRDKVSGETRKLIEQKKRIFEKMERHCKEQGQILLLMYLPKDSIDRLRRKMYGGDDWISSLEKSCQELKIENQIRQQKHQELMKRIEECLGASLGPQSQKPLEI